MPPTLIDHAAIQRSAFQAVSDFGRSVALPASKPPTINNHHLESRNAAIAASTAPPSVKLKPPPNPTTGTRWLGNANPAHSRNSARSILRDCRSGPRRSRDLQNPPESSAFQKPAFCNCSSPSDSTQLTSFPEVGAHENVMFVGDLTGFVAYLDSSAMQRIV